MRRILILALLLTALSLGLFFIPTREKLVIASTTSTFDTGLLDYLKEHFESSFRQVQVNFIAVGTGQAIELGKRGDADLLLVHNRPLEEEFVREGFGVNRVTIMFNDFIVVGPKGDPAGARGLDLAAAFRRVAAAGESGATVFISRADKSGTNLLEQSIWKRAGINPSGRPWYLEAAAGMATTLSLAESRSGYTLTDRGTWNTVKGKLGLIIIVENEPELINPYSAIVINPLRHSHVNSDAAEKFVAFLVSEGGQKLIADFRRDGEALFTPIFGRTTEVGLPAEEGSVTFWRGRANELAFTDQAQIIAGSLFTETLNQTLVTLKIASLAVGAASLIGIPSGSLLALREFRGKNLVNAIVDTMMGIPPVLVGLVVFLSFSRTGPLGTLQLLFTQEAMIIAQLIIILPLMTGIVRSAVSSVDRRIRELAMSLGADRRQLILTLASQARLGMFTAIAVGFGRAISEVGAALLVGAGIKGSTRTLPIGILFSTQRGEFELAISTGALLLLTALAVNILLSALQRGDERWSMFRHWG